MLSSIFAALAAIPKFIDLIERLSAWLSDQLDTYHKTRLVKEMDKAVDKAKTTKDTSDLDNMFKGK